MSNKLIDRLKEAVKGTNFWFSLVLLFGGLFIGFPENEARNAVSALFAVISSIFFFRGFFKNAIFDVKNWLNDANTWNYIAAILISIIPNFPEDIVPSIGELIRAIHEGNTQGILIALFSLITIIAKLFGIGIRKRNFTVLIVFLAMSLSFANAQDFEIPKDEVPEEILRPRFLFKIPDQTNWGRDLLLPTDLIQRLKSECKHPVHVKIADTGGSFTHRDLQQGQIPGSSYTGEPLLDLHGHGTHVAGIIAGKNVGVLWPLVETGVLTFSGVKILSNQGSGQWDWVAGAIMSELSDDKRRLSEGQYVVYNGSFGGGTGIVPNVENALKIASNAGIIWVCANGNTSQQGVQYPGRSIYTIGTASLDQGTLQRSSFSSWGPETDGGMPGRSINSTWKDNSYAVLSGTSMASPFLCAASAVALSKWGDKVANTDRMRAYLCKVATDIPPKGKDDFTGCGISYIRAILDTEPDGSVNPPPPPPPPPSKPPKPIRPVQTVLKGDWKMMWQIQASNTNDAALTGVTVSTVDDSDGEYTLTYKNDILSASKDISVITITEIDAAIITRLHSDDAVVLINKFASDFFAGRGLLLQSNSDHLDAAFWTSRFFEIIAKQRGLEVQVYELLAKDAAGNVVKIKR